MCKKFEELKGMTQEDLISYVQCLEKSLETEKEECKKYKAWWNEDKKKYDDFLCMMKTMLNLMK